MFLKLTRPLFNRRCSALRRCQRLNTNTALSPFSKEDTEEFMSFFPLVVKDITDMIDLNMEVKERFATCLNYNVPTGKRVRGLTTVISYKYLEKPENLTPDNIKLANILGWGTELMEASIVIIDDIIDKSTTRRNNICWYKKEGALAINDAALLHISCFKLLKKYFHHHPFYIQMCDFNHEIMFLTSIGQSLDIRKFRPEDISMQQFKIISKYKTGFYTFYYPTILGMYLSRTYNKEIHDQMKPIFFDLGEFFQINNDIHDCFSDESITGKFGSDIKESKCSWLAVRAMEKCSAAQRRFFMEHFGKEAKEEVSKIKDLYLELNLLGDYMDFENKFFESLFIRVESLNSPQKELLIYLIEKLVRQTKIYGNNLMDPSKLKNR